MNVMPEDRTADLLYRLMRVQSLFSQSNRLISKWYDPMERSAKALLHAPRYALISIDEELRDLFAKRRWLDTDAVAALSDYLSSHLRESTSHHVSRYLSFMQEIRGGREQTERTVYLCLLDDIGHLQDLLEKRRRELVGYDASKLEFMTKREDDTR